MKLYLGRLGTFVTVVKPQSSLAMSPFFAAAKVQSADDYDANSRRKIFVIQRAFADEETIEETAHAITDKKSMLMTLMLLDAF